MTTKTAALTFKQILLFTLVFCLVNTVKGNENTEIEYWVRYWNELHNTRKTEEFRKLYGTEVTYYGRQYTGERCYQQKKKFLTPDFKQFIISAINFTEYTSGVIKADFRKQVTTKKGKNEHDCYLLFRKKGSKYFIVGESDLQTDAKLGVNLDLGKTAGGSDLFIWVGLFVAIGMGGFIWYRNMMRMRSAKKIIYSVKPEVIHSEPVRFEPVAASVQEAVIAEKVTTAVLKGVKELISEKEEEGVGAEFEKYIATLFPKPYYVIKEWRSDKYHDGVYAESSKYPDFEINYSDNRYSIDFAVECKYRSAFYYNKIDWAKEHQLRTYREFAAEKDIRVFVVIGVGGDPFDPDNLYVVPLEQISATTLHKTELEDYRRYRRSPFYMNRYHQLIE